MVLSAGSLRRLLRRPVLTWKRRRREAPVGRVRVGEVAFVKLSGGPVVAKGAFSKVREERRGGQYVLTLRLRGFRRLSVPFPVVKRDRRSWVVCALPPDADQQRLLAVAEPTLSSLLPSGRGTARRGLGPRLARQLLAAFAREPRTDASLLVWLALLASRPESGRLSDTLAAYARKPARRVVPFAVFS